MIEDNIDKIISRKYSASFMSNSKWIKLIEMLVNNASFFDICEVKLIHDERIRQLMIDGTEIFGHDYYEKSMEGMVTDPITPGWVLYKEIEWLNFPIRDERIHRLKKSIDELGIFKCDLTPDYLRIFAYSI